MNINKENIKGFCVLKIDGRIDATNYSLFEKAIVEITDGGETNIIINCRDLSYISSSGLRVFLIVLKKMMKLDGKLHLCEMQDSIKMVFEISNIAINSPLANLIFVISF